VNYGKISADERKEGQMLHHERSQWANTRDQRLADKALQK
jgi:hypothetical protein